MPYVIDQKNCWKEEDVNVVTLDSKLEKVDLLVVTPVTEYENIYPKLYKKTESMIVKMLELFQCLFYE